MKKKMKITERDYIKAHRKASREAEIEDHTRPVNFCRVHKSKKVYDRNRSKAENKRALPYLCFELDIRSMMQQFIVFFPTFAPKYNLIHI